MNNTLRYAVWDTSWGAFGMVEQEGRLLATFLPRPRRETLRVIHSRWPHAVEAASAPSRFQQAIVEYYEGKRVRFSMDIDLTGLSPFYQSVLEACRQIPYGQTASYADLARAVGTPNAARAVGGAMARNPLPLVIPCHRVLASDGSIGGYSSSRGVEEKLRLLGLENAVLVRQPKKAKGRAVAGLTFAAV